MTTLQELATEITVQHLNDLIDTVQYLGETFSEVSSVCRAITAPIYNALNAVERDVKIPTIDEKKAIEQIFSAYLDCDAEELNDFEASLFEVKVAVEELAEVRLFQSPKMLLRVIKEVENKIYASKQGGHKEASNMAKFPNNCGSYRRRYTCTCGAKIVLPQYRGERFVVGECYQCESIIVGSYEERNSKVTTSVTIA